jgi:hypothetical protein
METHVDGSAAIVGRTLVVVGPSAAGRPARIEAGEGVRVLIDGAVADGPLSVCEAAGVELEAPADEPRLDLHVEISADGMHASMEIAAQPGARYCVADQAPVPRLVVQRLLVERLSPPPIDVDRLEQALADAGVRFGLEGDALECLARAGQGREIVARGIAPVRGRAAEVRLAGGGSNGRARYDRAR